MERRSRGRAAAWLASLSAHALLALGLLVLPDRPDPPPLPPPAAVELVWLDEVSSTPLEATPNPTVSESPPGQEPAPGEPAPGEPAPGEPRPTPSNPRRGPPPLGPSPSPETAAPQSGGEGGLALSGLRGQSSSPRSGSGVRVPPATLVHPPPPPAGPDPRRPVLGPVALLPGDEEPRSLEAAGFKKRKDGSYKFGGISSPFVVIVRPDGRVRFRDRVATANGTAVRPSLLSPQKLAGEQQFRALKTKILKQTAGLRAKMARSWSKKHIRSQLAALSTRLKATWQKPAWTLERRRKQLFLLWDECEEPAEDPQMTDGVDDTLDQARTDAGTKARAMIVRFIRDELPANSDDAYPATELRALNGIRMSRQRFSPYASR